MENEISGNEEIIGYRIGKGYYCVSCYEKAVRDLKAVQDPEESGVTFPTKPIKKGNIEGFICKQCKTIKGDARILYIEKQREFETLSEKVQQMRSGLPYRFKEPRNLLDLEDMIVNCSQRISFVGSFFIQKPPGEEPEISEDDASGIHVILRDTEEDLHFILSKISEMRRKGLINYKNEEAI